MSFMDLKGKLDELPGLYAARQIIDAKITELEVGINTLFQPPAVKVPNEWIQIEAEKVEANTKEVKENNHSKGQKNFWDKLTPRQRKMRITKMNKARLSHLGIKRYPKTGR